MPAPGSTTPASTTAITPFPGGPSNTRSVLAARLSHVTLHPGRAGFPPSPGAEANARRIRRRSHHRLDDPSPADRQRPAEAVVHLGVGIVPQAVEHRGDEVARLDAAVNGIRRPAVRRAVHDAAADAAAGQGEGETVAPVVAA